ncbi:MAG: hypothetical protein ACJ746_29155 [Bryobacteraceae bacterium]
MKKHQPNATREKARPHVKAATILVAVVLLSSSAALPGDSSDVINPTAMPAGGTIDKRFQSYNVEMVEVTGGRFWAPYKDIEAGSSTKDTRGSASTPAGMNPGLYQYRPPLDLSNSRLRKLAAALGPTYVRVSGTWANTVYFADTDAPPTNPPKGFSSVLTRQQWKGVIDFAHAANAEVISSFATSSGVRDAEGAWRPEQARAFLSYTKSVGGRIAAAEFINEPNLSFISGAPKGYNAAAFARDMALFRPFLKEAAPDTLLLGPGSVAEGQSVALPANLGIIRSEDLLRATGPVYDVFSYHLYPAVSQRCASMSASSGTTADAALSKEWLARPDAIQAFYAELRDQLEPGKPIWITETADASCGGNPWASTFLDTFRYLDAHARLAQAGVQVLAHNTLAASDYGLLDYQTFAPRPNYWAALLWRRLMGTTVLKTLPASARDMPLYAHCSGTEQGAVTVLAINTDRSAARTVNVSGDSERYTLIASKLEDTHVQLNGRELNLGPNDSVPQLTGVVTHSGQVTLAPASITFLVFPKAHNTSCR